MYIAVAGNGYILGHEPRVWWKLNELIDAAEAFDMRPESDQDIEICKLDFVGTLDDLKAEGGHACVCDQTTN